MDVIDKKIIDCCKIVSDLYELPFGGTGGLAHIVFDDGNLEEDNILWCLKECENVDKYIKDYPLFVISKSKEALLKMLELKYIERFFVYYQYDNYKMYI